MSGREQKIITDRKYIADPQDTGDPDYILIKKALENDGKAFNSLVLKYKDMIYNLCFRVLGDYEEANDCAQETFIKVFKNLKGFKFESSFSTWLYRIAVNTCKNELGSLKHRMAKRNVSLDSAANPGDENGAGMRIHVSNGSSDPSHVYERKEREELIRKAIDSLGPKEKIMVILRDIEGKSYEEISEITGIKIGTVKSKLARARQELREKLRGVI